MQQRPARCAAFRLKVIGRCHPTFCHSMTSDNYAVTQVKKLTSSSVKFLSKGFSKELKHCEKLLVLWRKLVLLFRLHSQLHLALFFWVFFLWQCKSLCLKRVCARADILISLCADPSRIQTAETKLISNQNPLASFRGPHISPLPRLNNEGFQRLSSWKVQLRGPSEIRFDSAALLLFNLERW